MPLRSFAYFFCLYEGPQQGLPKKRSCPTNRPEPRTFLFVQFREQRHRPGPDLQWRIRPDSPINPNVKVRRAMLTFLWLQEYEPQAKSGQLQFPTTSHRRYFASQNPQGTDTGFVTMPAHSERLAGLSPRALFWGFFCISLSFQVREEHYKNEMRISAWANSDGWGAQALHRCMP